ncbi:serine/threonine-protein kinase [Virgisporangium aurantiacum]|uniref:non-specific serine/threonine protein kinase n=1 Tax=Virgisporangium aurantiacum TaxID=175570 RepID=A0A8J3Z3N7_9ACTN|nr:serine/threonine-protein kinase [Virgisporangium aurantiacum]GIJ56102.1 protein kinase [Virgisporangium aurantiacum]
MSTRVVVNNRYELEPLPAAKGGMGEVWFGRDMKLERRVAVKFVRFGAGKPEDVMIRRFVRESRIAARLEHPGVPAVYDVGMYQGRPYLVMQRIDGTSVSDLVTDQGPLPVGWAAAIAAQTCAVLSVAHAASLIHRDLKPSNLMLEPDGSIKVLDFGLAVGVDANDFSKITHIGQPIGTPHYMAPEQVLGALSSPASDLYALGCTLHEMLCGTPVFSGSTSFTVMNKQVGELPAPVRSIRADVPTELDELVLSLLEKKPEDRPASADAVYDRLLPLAVNLQPLAGALRSPDAASPMRMYATVVGRVFMDEPQPALSVEPATPAPVSDDADVATARDEAERLFEQERYNQAADVLADVVDQADRAADDDAVSLRRQYADALFESGDYHRAGPAYRELGKGLAERLGPLADDVLFCRLREATCQALLGQTTNALKQLQSLLDDERSRFSEHDARVLDLRRQIGLLQLGAGQRKAAEQTLTSLLADLRRLHGPEHPSITATADLLAGLRR